MLRRVDAMFDNHAKEEEIILGLVPPTKGQFGMNNGSSTNLMELRCAVAFTFGKSISAASDVDGVGGVLVLGWSPR